MQTLQEKQLAEEKRQYDTSLSASKNSLAGKSGATVNAGAKASSNAAVTKTATNTGAKSTAEEKGAQAYRDLVTGKYLTNNSTVSKLASVVGASNVPTKITSYSQAASYMKQQGVAKGDGGLMTESEWKARKNAGSKSAETAYASYSAYLNAFVQYRLQNPQK